MRTLSRPARLASFATIALALVAAIPARAGDASPNQLKAAIVFNIIRFVEFAPGDAGSSLSLCVAQSAAGARELAALGGQRAGSRTINVRMIDSARSPACNVVYLGAASAPEIAQASGRGVLVIGDGPAFIGSGGAVGLVRMGNQLRFEMNTRAARSGNVTISSKLLRLAARVQQ